MSSSAGPARSLPPGRLDHRLDSGQALRLRCDILLALRRETLGANTGRGTPRWRGVVCVGNGARATDTEHEGLRGGGDRFRLCPICPRASPGRTHPAQQEPIGGRAPSRRTVTNRYELAGRRLSIQRSVKPLRRARDTGRLATRFANEDPSRHQILGECQPAVGSSLEEPEQGTRTRIRSP